MNKSRKDWASKLDDINIQYFHACVKGKRKSNRILNIQREDGTWTKNEQELGAEIEEYYQKLFTSPGV